MVDVSFHLPPFVKVAAESIDEPDFVINDIDRLRIHPTFSAWMYVIR